MDYGLYISASGVSAEMARMDVRANNLANAQTPGFRVQTMATRFRPAVREEDHLPFANSNELLERLGAGIHPSVTRVSTAQGPLEETARSLDVAIEGTGWLTVSSGNAGDDALRLTRDGRMAMDARGRLVLASTGLPVVSATGGEITLDPRVPVVIRQDGVVEQNGAARGRLGIVDVADPEALVPDGGGMMRMDAAQARGIAQSELSRVHQGMVEQSSVDPVKEMMIMTSAGSAAQRNMRMVGLIAQNMQLAVSRLGRVA
jgi:flagellar basal body rod protein FlgG